MKAVLFISSFICVASLACGGSPPAAPAQAPEASHTAPATATTAAAATPATPVAANTPAPASKKVKAPGEATIGDTSTCPVSKEEFTVTASSPKATYNGKTYYFCCAGCDKKFAADPAKFVADASKK